MKTWRYIYIQAPEKLNGRLKHLAVYPLPHLLEVRFQAAHPADPEAQDEIGLTLSTETVTVRGGNLASLWNVLAAGQSEPFNGRRIDVPGPTKASVEFSIS